MELGTPPLLAGKQSKDIKVKIDRLNEDVLNKTLRWFSKFFAVSCFYSSLNYTSANCKGCYSK